MNIDMDINTLKDQSNVSSTNSSKKLSVHSSISYIKRMQALNNSSFQADQVENNRS